MICYHTPTKEQPKQSLIILQYVVKYVCFKEFFLVYQKIFLTKEKVASTKVSLCILLYFSIQYEFKELSKIGNFLNYV